MSNLNLYTGTLWFLYNFIYKINGKRLKLKAAISATLIFSLILFLNVMFVALIFARPIDKSVTFSVFILLFVFNSFIFIWKKKYEILEEKYREIKIPHRLLFLLFFVLLIVSAVFLGFFELENRS